MATLREMMDEQPLASIYAGGPGSGRHKEMEKSAEHFGYKVTSKTKSGSTMKHGDGSIIHIEKGKEGRSARWEHEDHKPSKSKGSRGMTPEGLHEYLTESRGKVY